MEVFISDKTVEEVAAKWVQDYSTNDANALCALINLVLKSSGCNSQLEAHDIEDPDNAPNRLADLQEEYQALKLTDYPLISKAKGKAFSVDLLTEFFAALIVSAHSSGVLYSDLAMSEHISTWVGTLSSTSLRPFRHTATVVSMAMATALCDVVNEISDEISTTMRQRGGELKNKKKVNQSRVQVMDQTIQENENKKAVAEGWLRDIFDAVFMHRYRDIDPKIRVECAAALGTWIMKCPAIFFEGTSLRYLGWLLSDANAQTRTEVVKQLLRIYSTKDVGRLRAFTDKFRPRMVEMAARDAEPALRASAVTMLDMIRKLGLLEPDDVDSIGRLIFDSEPRLRKAVAGFFAENVQDSFQAVIEELGDENELDEALGEEDDEDFDKPRKAWLKLKCLAEILDNYNSDNTDSESSDGGLDNGQQLVAAGIESRYSLAAKAICSGMPEIKEWEVLAGYLLHDLSTSSNDDAEDIMAGFKTKCQLTDKEEVLLLEVLNAAVEVHLQETIQSEIDKKGKPAKSRVDASRAEQEETAIHLAQMLPRLFRKFGSNAKTSSNVLRLERLLNLDIYQELRQSSTEYASLLDDVNNQFLSHSNEKVLAEASTTILRAKTFEDLEEITDGKVQDLWQRTLNTVRSLGVTNRPERLPNLSHAVLRISHLACITDCVEVFEARPTSTGKGEKEKEETKSNAENLLVLIESYQSGHSKEESAIVSNAMRAMLFYYMWKVQLIQMQDGENEVQDGTLDYSRFSTALVNVLGARSKLDPVRLAAIGTLLDLYTLFATFHHQRPSASTAREDETHASDLAQEIPVKAQDGIATSFLAAEKAFSQKSKKPLEPPADDDPPDDLDSEPEDSSDEEEDDDEAEVSAREQRRQHETLLAEQRLCELTGKIVLAMLGRVIDASGPQKGSFRTRLQRNKAKLGSNFKEVLAFLDEPKAKPPGRRKTPAAAKEKGAEKSKAAVTAEDEVEDEIEDGDADERALEEGGEEDLRRRELHEGIENDSNGEAEGGKEVEEEDPLGD